MPKLVASGGRKKAFDNFSDALCSHPAEMILLLVDSEVVVTTTVWAHLKAHDGWNRPEEASDEQAHLMVQCMEAWLLADREALQAFYARGFAVNALPGAVDVESIWKPMVMSSLERASKQSQKGEYHKTRHAYALLQLIDPAKVRAASRHAARFRAVQPCVPTDRFRVVEAEDEVSVRSLALALFFETVCAVRGELSHLPGLPLVLAEVLNDEGLHAGDSQQSFAGCVDSESGKIAGNPASAKTFSEDGSRSTSHKAIQYQISAIGGS